MTARSSKGRIVVIGELNVDLVASGLKTEPILGHEILADDFEIVLGSASAIFACGAARLGDHITFVSLVGRDGFGRFCKEALMERGIAVDHVVETDEARTGVTIVMSTQRDRAFVTYLGAIAELRIPHVPPDIFSGSDHLHLTSFYLQSGLQPDFPKLMTAARQQGLTTSFDPNSDPDRQGIQKIRDVLVETDILFVNETEAKVLTSQQEVKGACRRLAEFCPFVVVKLGSKGSIALREGEFVEAAGFDVATIDTTGAGDSFAAGFVHAFLKGGDTFECLAAGNACGALSATRAGGTAGQPDAARLHEFMAEQSVQRSVSGVW